eukprot:GEZU01018293.1.p1 GENE.GEZU01018293.1~~GEZU01018293.1.p1  ORF type:complete len:192 (-),score=15.07 GEZU01018293.1:172-747(-)
MTMNSFLSSSVSTKSCTSRTNRDLVSDPYRIRDDGGASNHETTCHSLQDLSDDVLFFIFSFLRLAEFENLRMVNSYFNALFRRSESLWQMLCLRDGYPAGVKPEKSFCHLYLKFEEHLGSPKPICLLRYSFKEQKWILNHEALYNCLLFNPTSKSSRPASSFASTADLLASVSQIKATTQKPLAIVSGIQM